MPRYPLAAGAGGHLQGTGPQFAAGARSAAPPAARDALMDVEPILPCHHADVLEP
jgi:hypothetical protein